MGGEKFTYSSAEIPQAPTVWDSLRQPDGAQALGVENVFEQPEKSNTENVFEQPEKKPSIIEKATESLATRAARFMDGWRAKLAKKKAEIGVQNATTAVEAATEAATGRENAYNNFIQVATETRENYNNDVATFDALQQENSEHAASINRNQNYINEAAERVDELEESNNQYIDKQINNAINTVRSVKVNKILAAEANVVKTAINSFARSVIAKMPRVEMPKDQLQVEQNAKEQIAKFDTAGAAKTNFDAAKTKRSETVTNAVSSFKDSLANFARTANERKENADEIANLEATIEANYVNNNELNSQIKQNKAKMSNISNRQEAARELLERIPEYYNSVKQINEKKQQETEQNLASAKKQLERATRLVELERMIGRRNPNVVKKEIAEKIAEAQKKERELLFIKEKLQREEVTDEYRKDLDEFLDEQYNYSSLLKKRDALNEYEELREEQYKNILDSRTAKNGVRFAAKSAMKSMKQKFAF